MTSGLYMVEHRSNFLGLSHDMWQFKHGLLSVAFLASGGLYWRYERVIKRYMNRGVLAVMSIAYFLIFMLFSEEFHKFLLYEWCTLYCNKYGDEKNLRYANMVWVVACLVSFIGCSLWRNHSF